LVREEKEEVEKVKKEEEEERRTDKPLSTAIGGGDGELRIPDQISGLRTDRTNIP
jgi:hypothetical protein